MQRLSTTLLGFVLLGCGTEVLSEPSTSGSQTSTGRGGGTTTAAGPGSGGGGAIGPTGPTGSGGSVATGGSGGGGGMGGMGGAQSEACQLLVQASITGVELLDAGGDGTWSAGEQATLNVTVDSPVENFQYPGAGATHSQPLVTPPDAENILFGWFANTPTDIGLQFSADASTPSGTMVTFQIELRHINDDCQGSDTASHSAIIQ